VGKLFLFVAAIIVVYAVLKAMTRSSVTRRKASDLRNRKQAPLQAEAMIPCAFCEINVPRSEAISDGSRYFCSDEHRRHFGKRAKE